MNNPNDFDTGHPNYLPPELAAQIMDLEKARTSAALDELARLTEEYGGYPELKPNVSTCDALIPDAPDALTLAERELLTLLIEECAEVQQRCTKILRFGLRVNPWTGKHNRDTLESELGDIQAIYELMYFADMIDDVRVHDHKRNKLQALAKLDGRLRHAKVPKALL